MKDKYFKLLYYFDLDGIRETHKVFIKATNISIAIEKFKDKINVPLENIVLIEIEEDIKVIV